MDLFGTWGNHHFWNGNRMLDWLTSILLLLILLLFSFEIWMFIDCIANKKLSIVHKILWVIGMFLLHPFAAIAYFFISSQHHSKKKT